MQLQGILLSGACPSSRPRSAGTFSRWGRSGPRSPVVRAHPAQGRLIAARRFPLGIRIQNGRLLPRAASGCSRGRLVVRLFVACGVAEMAHTGGPAVDVHVPGDVIEKVDLPERVCDDDDVLRVTCIKNSKEEQDYHSIFSQGPNCYVGGKSCITPKANVRRYLCRQKRCPPRDNPRSELSPELLAVW